MRKTNSVFHRLRFCKTSENNTTNWLQVCPFRDEKNEKAKRKRTNVCSIVANVKLQLTQKLKLSFAGITCTYIYEKQVNLILRER